MVHIVYSPFYIRLTTASNSDIRIRKLRLINDWLGLLFSANRIWSCRYDSTEFCSYMQYSLRIWSLWLSSVVLSSRRARQLQACNVNSILQGTPKAISHRNHPRRQPVFKQEKMMKTTQYHRITITAFLVLANLVQVRSSISLTSSIYTR